MPIYSPLEGKISFLPNNGNAGNEINISVTYNGDEYVLRLLHMQDFTNTDLYKEWIDNGEEAISIKQGTFLGLVGGTGGNYAKHLHFGILKEGGSTKKHEDYVDPLEFIFGDNKDTNATQPDSIGSSNSAQSNIFLTYGITKDGKKIDIEIKDGKSYIKGTDKRPEVGTTIQTESGIYLMTENGGTKVDKHNEIRQTSPASQTNIFQSYGVTKDGKKIEIEIKEGTSYIKGTNKRPEIGTTIQTDAGIYIMTENGRVKVDRHNVIKETQSVQTNSKQTFGITQEGLKIEIELKNGVSYIKGTDERPSIGTTVQTDAGIYKMTENGGIKVDNHNEIKELPVSQSNVFAINTNNSANQSFGITKEGMKIELEIKNGVSYIKGTNDRPSIGTTVQTDAGIYKMTENGGVKVDSHNQINQPTNQSSSSNYTSNNASNSASNATASNSVNTYVNSTPNNTSNNTAKNTTTNIASVLTTINNLNQSKTVQAKESETYGITQDGKKIELDIKDGLSYIKGTNERPPVGATVQTVAGVYKMTEKGGEKVSGHNQQTTKKK